MGKAINALCNAQEETSDSVQGTRLVFLDFDQPKIQQYPTPGPGCRERFIQKKNNRVPHERVVTEIREVKYLRDGYVKEEGDIKPRKIVLETNGTEIVKEVLVPRDSELLTQGYPARVVGQVTRDLRRKDTTQE